MSLLLSKKHLRVEIPQTIDGVNLLYDENQKVVIKTVYLPFTAKRSIESNQSKKPKILQAKITVVEGDLQPVKETVAKINPMLAENLRLKLELEELKAAKETDQTAPKNKGGRPKKVTEENV